MFTRYEVGSFLERKQVRAQQALPTACSQAALAACAVVPLAPQASCLWVAPSRLGWVRSWYHTHSYPRAALLLFPQSPIPSLHATPHFRILMSH